MAEEPLRSANILANTLIERIHSDPGAAEALKADPAQILKFASSAVATSDTNKEKIVGESTLALDTSVYRIVVISLGACVVGTVFSILIIAIITVSRVADPNSVTINIPDGLVALASAAVGALAGLLTPVGRNAGGATAPASLPPAPPPPPAPPSEPIPAQPVAPANAAAPVTPI